MNGKFGKKAAILVIAGLMATASGAVRADHDADIVTPLVTLFAVGTLLSYDRASHHYHHYYSYRRHGYYGGHSPRHGYHGYKRHSYGHYRKHRSSHGHYARPRSHSHGGYHRY